MKKIKYYINIIKGYFVRIPKGVLAFLIGVFVIFLLYTGYVEYKNIQIDNYNFAQFEKIQETLSLHSPETYKFGNLKEFNEVYGANISPINKCYDISTYNGSDKFAFRIESLIYIWNKIFCVSKIGLTLS